MTIKPIKSITLQSSKRSEEIELHRYASVAIPTLSAAIFQKSAIATSLLFATSVAEEFLIKNNNKHYFTRAIIYNHVLYDPWVSKLISLFPKYNLPIKAASLAVSLATANILDDFLNF